MAKQKTYIIKKCDKYLASIGGNAVTVGEMWDTGWKTGVSEAEYRLKCLPIFGEPSDKDTAKVLLHDVLVMLRDLKIGKEAT
jgi:hypothetical protein